MRDDGGLRMLYRGALVLALAAVIFLLVAP